MGRRLGTLAIFLVMMAGGALIWSALSQWVLPPDVPQVVEPTADLGRVRVEVRNAGGRSGMARKATEHLRDLGFDVVFVGNADWFDQDSTVVVDRVGRLDKARAVAQVLDATAVASEPDSSLYLDVTVLLGSEWDAAPEPAPQTVEGGWWDLRRWLRAPDDEPESENES